MALLARLAGQLGGLQETVATDGLGQLLADPEAAQALTAALRSGVPELPGPLRFTTQAADEDTRPDVVARDEAREVLHVEGKFWAGLTDAQARDRYLQRLAAEHHKAAPGHPCPGVLLWVCPPRRADVLWPEVCQVSGAARRPGDGRWWFADTPAGQVVALADWPTVLDALEPAGGAELAEDTRQLRALVHEVDAHAFLPWTHQDLTDQHTARQWVALLGAAESIRSVAQRAGVAEAGGKRNTTVHGRMWRGPALRLAGVYTGLIVSLPLFAQHGRSPLWLRWWHGRAVIARRAFPGRTIDTDDGCVLPVPVTAGRLRAEVIQDAVAFLSACRDQLASAVAPNDNLAEDESDVPDEDPGGTSDVDTDEVAGTGG